MTRLHRLAATFSLALLSGVAASQDAPPADDRPFPLMAGDPAPPLGVKWFRPGSGDLMQSGRPYIVEFWATWCAPCVENIPRLTELQAKYKGRLTIVGVSVWEPRPDEVGGFVEKQADRMAYAVALDDIPPAPADVENPSDWAKENGKASRAWLRASGWDWDGIPVTFIVDERGRIAWIGSPRDMEEPLAAVIEGRWDLASYNAGYREERAISLKARAIHAHRRAAQRAKDHEAFMKDTDALLALGPSMSGYAGSKFQYLLIDMNEPERAYAYGREAVAEGDAAYGNFDALNQIAATIVHRVEHPGPAALNLALAASLRAAEVSAGKDVYTLTTLAEVHAVRGEFADAAAAQRRAIDAAPAGRKPELSTALDEYLSRAPGP